MNSLLGRRGIAAAVLVAIVAMAAIATAMASSSPRAARRHTTHRHAVSGRLGHIFRALDARHVRAHRVSAATASVPLPAAVFDAMSRWNPGLNPSAAVFTGGTYPTWIVPGSTEVCLVVGPMRAHDVPGAVCGSVSGSEHGFAMTTENAVGAPVVIGLAPDGNASVEVTNANGTSESVPVVNNVYEVISGTPSTATLKEASGRTFTRRLAVLRRP